MKMVHRATPKFVQIGPNNLYIYTQLYTDMIIYVYNYVYIYIFGIKPTTYLDE